MARRYSFAKKWAIRIASVICVIALWQFVYDSHIITNLILVSPLDTAIEFYQLVTLQVCEPQCLPQAVALSLYELVAGFVLALIVGISIGVTMGLYDWIDRVARPYIVLLFTLPHVIFLFIFIFVFGFGIDTKIAYIFFAAFPILVINVSNGIKSVDKLLVDVATGFSANTRQLVTKVILPGSMPYIVSGVRVSLGTAFITLVVAETFIGFTGIGAIIHNAGHEWQWPLVFSGAIVIAIMALALTLGTRPLEKRYFVRRQSA